MPAEESCILGVEGKDETDAEDVETLLAVGIRHIVVLFRERIIEFADELARLDGDLHLPCDVFIAHIDEEVQAIRLAREVFKQDFLRLGVRRLHVIDKKLREVRADDPARTRRVRECRRIAPRLLDGLQQCSVALANRLSEALAEALLLDHDVRRWDHHVDEARMVEHDLLLEHEQIGGIRSAVHGLQELHPELLTLALLVAPALPFRRKRLCRLRLCSTFYHANDILSDFNLYHILSHKAPHHISAFCPLSARKSFPSLCQCWVCLL